MAGLCQTTIASVGDKPVATLEGLGSTSLHPIQAAFIKEQVPQCGYCTSGMIMSAAALLAEKAKPTEDEVRSALDGTPARLPSECALKGRAGGSCVRGRSE